MNNQKDTQKTSLNSYGQSNVLDVKSLNNRPIYEFANKKTEKLVTALYMVTDCMDTDDALKVKLRELGVGLLSDMYKLSTLSPLDKHNHISSSLSHVYEVLSFIEIAYTIGFISEMNTAILKKEFMILIGELESHQKKDKHFTFILDEQMFSARQDLAVNKEVKRTLSDSVSFINKESPLQNFKSNKLNLSSTTNLTDKKDRIEKILNLIKEKKDISIKDISSSFTDCSEKTIQRELNSLVEKGQIKKTGAKRWSRYQVVSSN
ncbi:MAG: DeoR family transcriptional regulator [Candidatus Paceibacterota bacterium]|jgi:hypothetical protein